MLKAASLLQMKALMLVLALTACSASPVAMPQSSALYTTWGVRPYDLRPDGLLINGLTPVDPMEHF